jgi:hypothetical protein
LLIFTGSASSLIMLAMFSTSFFIIRKTHFNLFYFTHLPGIMAVVLLCLHASTVFYCTIPGLSIWLLDWGMRVFELREKLDSRLDALGNSTHSPSFLSLRRRCLAFRLASGGRKSAPFFLHPDSVLAVRVGWTRKQLTNLGQQDHPEDAVQANKKIFCTTQNSSLTSV